MEWISVKDRFPEEDRTVLVYVPKWKDCEYNNNGIDIASLNNVNEKYWNVGDGHITLEFNEVSHWMLLPLAPVVLPQSKKIRNYMKNEKEILIKSIKLIEETKKMLKDPITGKCCEDNKCMYEIHIKEMQDRLAELEK